MSILTARLSKNRFPLKSGSLLIAAALLSAGAQAADLKPTGMSNKPLDLNYTRVSNAALFDTLGANFCHLKSDALKISVIVLGMKVRPDTKMILTVSGKSFVKSYSVFEAGSPVAPAASPAAGTRDPDYLPTFEAEKGKFYTKDLVKEWHVNFFPNSQGDWAYKPKGEKYDTTTRFCFYKFPKGNNRFNDKSGRPVFYDNKRWPIFENLEMTAAVGLPPGHNSKADYQTYSFKNVCLTTVPGHKKIEVTLARDPERLHYWPKWDIIGHPPKRPEAIRKYIDVKGNWDGFFDREIFFTNIVKGDGPEYPGEYMQGDRKIVPYSYDSRGIPTSTTAQTVTYNLLSGFPRDSRVEYVYLDRGGKFELTVNNRNISKIELAISDSSGVQVLRWKGGNGVNDMAFSNTGVKIFETGPEVDKSNDPYAAFYQHPQDYFRGTLAAVNDKYKAYIEKMPLSLPPKNAGDLNLLNMEELVFTLGGGGPSKSDKYTLSVEGKPLKFAPLYVNDKVKLTAMELRNACK